MQDEYILKTLEDGTKITVRDLQLELLEMMKDIDLVCKKNNINYFLGGGSCLGAVRHKGFIPWDDDMDIAMSREEYNKFIKALDKDLPKKKYCYHCYEKDKRYTVTWPAMKIRKKKTYIREINSRFLPNRCSDSDGIFIDVFIYDYMSNKKIKDLPLRIINTILMPIIIFFELLYINPIPLKALYRYNARLYGKLCKNSEYFADELTWTFRKITKPFLYRYDDIYPVKYTKFEDVELPIPGNSHEYLRKNYGDDYMEFPPENKRFGKHTLDINLKNSRPNDVVKSKIGFVYAFIFLLIALILWNDISFIFFGLAVCVFGFSLIYYINK